MADGRLRRLERLSLEGDLGAKAQLLHQRVRVGSLGLGWLELLALIGHPAGCLALGERPALFVPDLVGAEAWEAWLSANWRPKHKRAILRLGDGERLHDLALELRRRWGLPLAYHLGCAFAEVALPAEDPWRASIQARNEEAGTALDSFPAGEGRLDDFLSDSVLTRIHLTPRSWIGYLADEHSADSPLPVLRLRAGLIRSLAPKILLQGADTADLDLPHLAFRRRVRILSLSKPQLEVAAFLGHPQARREVSSAVPVAPENLLEWANTLARWSRKLNVRVAVAAARFALPVWEAAAPGDERPRVALEAAGEWLRGPTKKRLARAEAAFDGNASHADVHAQWAAEACMLAARACAADGKQAGGMAVVRAADACGDDQRVRAAVREELLAWAVGDLADDFADAPLGQG